jgi:hypothetical protein
MRVPHACLVLSRTDSTAPPSPASPPAAVASRTLARRKAGNSGNFRPFGSRFSAEVAEAREDLLAEGAQEPLLVVAGAVEH